MEIVAFASPVFALALIAFALRRDLVRACAPALFVLTTLSMGLAYLASARGELPAGAMAAVGAVVGGAGLVAAVLEIDARLRAAENGAPAVEGRPRAGSEDLFSFKRKGRAALVVFVRRDHTGHILEAAAYDPEDYL